MNITPEQAKLLTQALINISAGESAFEIMEELDLFAKVNDRFATWNKEKIKELGLEC